jgi:pyruvate dehydrogenase E1 component alpha subunit
MDVLAVEAATRTAVEAVRGGAGPHFLEFRTYRFRAHSMYDPDRYRDKAEIARWKQRDPIQLLGNRMRAAGEIDDDGWAGIEADVVQEINAAVAAAESAPEEPVADLTRFVYAEREEGS